MSKRRSQSGPVRVIRRFTPEPDSHIVIHNRALAKIRHLESQAADLTAWRERRQRLGQDTAPLDKQIIEVADRLIAAYEAEKPLREGHELPPPLEEAIHHNPVGK